MGDRLRAEGVDRRRKNKDQRAREEGGELRTDLATGSCPGVLRGSDKPNALILLAESKDAAQVHQRRSLFYPRLSASHLLVGQFGASPCL